MQWRRFGTMGTAKTEIKEFRDGCSIYVVWQQDICGTTEMAVLDNHIGIDALI